jgi:hypothetical protein
MGEEPAEGPGRGEAWAIPTGGALPRRGDRVIPIEQVRREQDVLVFSGPLPRKPHIAEPGEEIRPGAVLVQRGEVIRPAAVGALAACGFGEIEVYRRPRVALLATGDELVDPPALPPPGRVVNSNVPTLAAELAALGCEVHLGGTVPDAPEALTEAFWTALEGGHHVILTTGAGFRGRYGPRPAHLAGPRGPPDRGTGGSQTGRPLLRGPAGELLGDRTLRKPRGVPRRLPPARAPLYPAPWRSRTDRAARDPGSPAIRPHAGSGPDPGVVGQGFSGSLRR